MKKVIFIIISVIFIISLIPVSAFNDNNENMLFCDDNGDFKILIVSDPQCDNKNQWNEARDELETLITRSNPNLVIINGDMNSRNQIPYDEWEKFISPITSRNIYWCTTNGNHDPFVKRYYKMYKSYDYCLNSVVNAGNIYYEYSRPMNYVIPIYSKDGKNIVFSIFCMDSGTYNSSGYEGLTKNQINWYKQQSNILKDKNNGNAVTSLVCMHIPLTQTIDMFYSSSNKNAISKKKGNIYNIYGITNQYGTGIENYTCQNGTFIKDTYIHATAKENDRGFFNEVLKQGDVKAIIFGHEHNTNLIGSYKGVLMGFAGKLSTGCYSDILCRGGRVISFNQDNPQNFTTEWLGSIYSSKDQPKIYSDGSLAQ
ncbi:MAG: metallophosphoesterase [Clostridia bacterium]|nr:metallophosphoesterase [Clostridia bacterium]